VKGSSASRPLDPGTTASPWTMARNAHLRKGSPCPPSVTTRSFDPHSWPTLQKIFNPTTKYWIYRINKETLAIKIRRISDDPLTLWVINPNKSHKIPDGSLKFSRIIFIVIFFLLLYIYIFFFLTPSHTFCFIHTHAHFQHNQAYNRTLDLVPGV